MSVLSRAQILQRIADRELYVGPIINSQIQFGRSSVDLRLGTSASLVRGNNVATVDPKNYVSKDQGALHLQETSRQRKLEKISFPFGNPFVLHANSLMLVPTYEWVKIPPNLQGIVTARSTWAREGLSIATAVFVNPGYSGIITLELANLGQIPIILYPGMRVAQIAFSTIDVVADDADSRVGHFDGSIESFSGNVAMGDEAFISKRSTP